ncbi:MAG: S1 RNA-binding domain-containing protein [Aquificaceae bacterium]
MGDFEKLLQETTPLRELKRGNVVRCKVVKVEDKLIYVDLGYKVEGIIPREELPEVKPGDEIKAVILKFSRGGSPILSYKKYIESKLYALLKTAKEKNKLITGTVLSAEKDGYWVDISGLRAFLPVADAAKGLKVGKKVVANVQELQETGNGLVVRLSQKEYIKSIEKKRAEEVIENIKVGDILEAKVIKVDPEKGITLLIKGALRVFVPVEEISWNKNADVSRLVKLGQRLNVKIKRIPKDKQFVFASIRETQEHPWERAKKTIYKGATLQVKVLEHLEKGLLLSVMEGVEGFVPKDEISYDGTIPQKGSKVNALVLEFDPERRKLVLSLKRLLPKPWEEYLKLNPAGTRIKGKVFKIEGSKAFVELTSGVQGVIQRSDISWIKSVKIEDVLELNKEYEFMVLGLDGKYVKLGVKQLSENPLDLIFKKYKVGDKVTLKVKAIHSFGAFLQFEEGLDGLLPISEIPKGTKLQEKQEVEVRIIELSQEKITLSMKEAEPQEETSTSSGDKGFTLGDLFKKIKI